MRWRGTRDDPDERPFRLDYSTCRELFRAAVLRAKGILIGKGMEATRLESFSWHGLRHSFASRLVMAGTDLVTVQRLGGWRTLAMVARYSHLSPAHARAAVERIGGRVDSEAALKLPRPHRAPAGAVS